MKLMVRHKLRNDNVKWLGNKKTKILNILRDPILFKIIKTKNIIIYHLN